MAIRILSVFVTITMLVAVAFGAEPVQDRTALLSADFEGVGKNSF